MKTAGRTMTLPLLACSVVWTGNHAAKGEIKVEIGDGVLEQAERSRPAEVFVYEVLPADPGLWMERMTRVVGIRGESEDTKAQLTLAEGSRHLEVRKISSATFYGEMDMLWKEEPTPEKTRFKVPSDQESREITLTWLGKFGFDDGNLKNVMISMEDELFELTTPDNRDRPKKVVVGKNVEVRRRVNGLPVYGPGSKIKLYIGEGGNVRGFTAVWRQLDPSSSVLGHKASRGERRGRTVRPVSAREAFDVLRKDPLNRIPMLDVRRIMIDQVELAYYGRSAVEPQRFLQPVYVFRGAAYTRTPDGKEAGVPYEQYVLALAQPFEPIWPAGRELKSRVRPDTKRRTPRDKDEKGG